jgi:hypothetical protein
MVIRHIFRTFGIFYGTLVYYVVIWYIFTILVYCTTKNLATLVSTGFLNVTGPGGALLVHPDIRNKQKSKESLKSLEKTTTDPNPEGHSGRFFNRFSRIQENACLVNVDALVIFRLG